MIGRGGPCLWIQKAQAKTSYGRGGMGRRVEQRKSPAEYPLVYIRINQPYEARSASGLVVVFCGLALGQQRAQLTTIPLRGVTSMCLPLTPNS